MTAYNSNYLTKKRVLKRLKATKTHMANTGEMLFQYGRLVKNEKMQQHGKEMVGAAGIAASWIRGVGDVKNEGLDAPKGTKNEKTI